MPTPLKPDGRAVWNLANDIAMSAAELKTALIEPLGSTDPVKYQRAMKAALKLADAIHMSALEIDRICELAAKRGGYGEGE